MIERNRPAPTGDELAAMYAHPNNCHRWAEHRLRTELTAVLGRHTFVNRRLIVDPAAGLSTTARELAGVGTQIITGDLAPTADVTYPGREAAELMLELAAVGHRADVIVLGEILEHVDEPLELLVAARRLAAPTGGLLVSTPLDEPPGVNPEHVWRWDRDGVTGLLVDAGWHPIRYVELELELPHWPPGYRCQLHAAEVAR